MESTVEWTERLCDEVEALDPRLFHSDWRKVSIPASVAAIRVCYYVGGDSKLIYEKLYYVLVTNRSRWDSLSQPEQSALLERLGVPSVMVYVKI
jgi:hypothetical protein